VWQFPSDRWSGRMVGADGRGSERVGRLRGCENGIPVAMSMCGGASASIPCAHAPMGGGSLRPVTCRILPIFYYYFSRLRKHRGGCYGLSRFTKGCLRKGLSYITKIKCLRKKDGRGWQVRRIVIPRRRPTARWLQPDRLAVTLLGLTLHDQGPLVSAALPAPPHRRSWRVVGRGGGLIGGPTCHREYL